MKAIILFIVFSCTCLFSLSAQENDSIKAILQPSDLQLKKYNTPYKNRTEPIFLADSGRYKQALNFSDPIVKKQEKEGFFSSSYSKFVIPVALISYGIATRGNKSLLELDHSTSNEVNEHLTVPIPFDDYSQFAPAVAVFGLDFAGIKAKHNLRDRTIIMATSYLVMGATVQTMKSSLNVWRPDHSNNNSFPSGHTATAFVGAHILFKEYKDVSPWIGIGGYAVATGTGVLRVLNKKHWVSDVVTGAGVGVLSAEVGYLLLPVFHNLFHIENAEKNLAIVPMIGDKNYGVGMVYNF